jgi:DNA-binding NtrC family response regulator
VLILVVEDSAELRALYERVLLDAGHSMCWAENVEGARKLLRSEREIALVLLDYELTDGKSGLQIAKDVARKIPVFMVSGTSRDAMRAAVSNTLEGVTLFFDKDPIEWQSLLDEIERVDRTRHNP